MYSEKTIFSRPLVGGLKNEIDHLNIGSWMPKKYEYADINDAPNAIAYSI